MEKCTDKICPIRNDTCTKDCAWWCEFGRECAVPLLAGMFADSDICRNVFDWDGDETGG